MLYVVQYLDATGNAVSLKIEANTREEARWISRIPERRILSVREDLVGRLAFAIEPPGPDQKNQAVFLQSLSSALSTGKTANQAVHQMLEKSTWIKYKKDQLGECETLSDYLALFRFNQFAVLMARAAEKTGQFSQALRTAARFLLDKEKIKSEVSSEFRTGVIYIVLGLAFFFCVPAFLSNSLESLLKGNGGIVVPNNFTNFLMFTGYLTKQFWWVPFVVLAIVFFYRAVVWRILKRLPFFSVVEAKNKLDRSTEFLSVYEMLHKAGFVDADIIAEMIRASYGYRKNIYQKIYAHLAKSEDLGQALDEEDWDQTVRDGMAVLHEIDADQQQYVLDAMKETLHLQNVHVARQISKILGRIGFFLMMFAAIAAVLGFYLPLAGAAGNVMHH
ncbi:MAG: type II secretion system F family protein [Gammaproteobacteria bacterium]